MADAVVRLGVKPGPKSKFSSPNSAKRAKIEQDRLRGLSRISIGTEKSRWDRVKEENRLNSHPEVAKFLLDKYESCYKNVMPHVHADIPAPCSTPTSATNRHAWTGVETPVKRSPLKTAVRRSPRTIVQPSPRSIVQPFQTPVNPPFRQAAKTPQQSPFAGIFRPFTPKRSTPLDVALDDSGNIIQAVTPNVSAVKFPKARKRISLDDKPSIYESSESSEEELSEESDVEQHSWTDSDSMEDTCDDDPDFTPSDLESQSNCRGVEHRKLTPAQFAEETIHIVHEEDLMKLAKMNIPKKCSEYGCAHIVTPTLQSMRGTSAKMILWVCMSGHCVMSWCSQPEVGDSPTVHGGDLKLATAILSSGNNFDKVELYHQFANLDFLPKSLFFGIQRNRVVPTINNEFGSLNETAMEKLSGRDIVVCGDARNDSPGYCAMYCTYTLMCHETLEILAMTILDKRHADGKSPNMELMAFKSTLKRLQDQGVNVVEVVTDQHPQIIKFLRELNVKRVSEGKNAIIHSFDLWHLSKNLGKKLANASKIKGCEKLKPWIRPICNHMFYIASNCDESLRKFKDMWKGILHHVQGSHVWLTSEGLTMSCNHESDMDEDDTKLLVPDSAALKALKQILFCPRLLKNLSFLVRARSTGQLESFHELILKYCSKRFAFSYPVYKARNYLAALDYAANLDRKQAMNRSGSPIWSRRVSRQKDPQWTVAKVMEKKSYPYVREIFTGVAAMQIAAEDSIYKSVIMTPSNPKHIHRNVSRIAPMATEEILQNRERKQRFKKEEK